MQKGSTRRQALPVDGFLPEIDAALIRHRAVVVTAAAGAGKTTRVPPALVGRGRVLLLQPRRVAARATARRIADEQGWTAGREVGWHVRFDRRESPETTLLVATEGILTARLQQDPLLSDFATVVLDEFHERGIHSDLGLALTKQAWTARDDLRIVVMSATLDARAVSSYLNDCPVVDVPGRLFPVDITYQPALTVEDAAVDAARSTDGAVLVFLPGVREIEAAASGVASRVAPQVPVLVLHGRLDARQQDAVLAPSSGARVILATNIAETTLTVPDVRVVVDAGWQKVARYDADRGIDRLDTERVSRDAADQRAGRAGRVAAGRAVRLWDAFARLAPHRQPDIARVDLASPVLDVVVWGADPRTFDWFDPPRPDRLDAALTLLGRLGLIDERGRPTPLGRQVQRLPLHPRLGRFLLEAGGAPQALRAAAVLSDGVRPSTSGAATTCDLWSAIEQGAPATSAQTIADLRSSLAAVVSGPLRDRVGEEEFRRSVLAAYPDRVGRRREPGGHRLLLSSGTGARLGRESGVVNHEFVVAIDVGASNAAASGEAIVRMASGVERDWLGATSAVVEHRFDPDAGLVRAEKQTRYDAIVLSVSDAAVDTDVAGALLADVLIARGPSGADGQLLARCRAAGVEATFEDLVRAATAGISRLRDVDLASALPFPGLAQLARDAPTELPLPSGRRARLAYQEDGRIVAAVKLQELFGLADTPRVGRGRVPVVFELLAPNGRPVQITSDLRSFWTHGYQEVRRELRARYPKHPWPEDPWTAQPTHRTVRRT